MKGNAKRNQCQKDRDLSVQLIAVHCKTLLIDIVSLNTFIETHRTFSKTDFAYPLTTSLSISRSGL